MTTSPSGYMRSSLVCRSMTLLGVIIRASQDMNNQANIVVNNGAEDVWQGDPLG